MYDTKLLSLNELAERTGLPLAWLRREADEGRLPCLRVGKRRMFDPALVRQNLNHRQAREARHE